MYRRRRSFGDGNIIFLLVGLGFFIYPSMLAPMILIIGYIVLRVTVLKNVPWDKQAVENLVGDDVFMPVGSGSEEAERRKALREAQIYLAPYKYIWGDLRLSNHYCSLYLGHDGATISGKEKVPPFRSFNIIDTRVHSYFELWNIFCKYFSFNTHYNGLLESCHRFGAVYVEDDLQPSEILQPVDDKTVQAPQPEREPLDINNCSEIELTELPGISIVMAKKVINKREEIGGFKSVDDFFTFLRLKKHMRFRLQELVKVEKMKGYVRKKLNGERHLDI